MEFYNRVHFKDTVGFYNNRVPYKRDLERLLGTWLWDSQGFEGSWVQAFLFAS